MALSRGRALGSDLLALAAGAALPLAFDPFGLWPLAVLCPAALFALWHRASPGRAAWRGWLFGLGMFGLGVSWVVESFQYNDIAYPVAAAVTGALVVSLALFPALLGAVAMRLCRGLGEGGRLLGVLPAAWLAFEWLRGIFLTGFPWLQLGYSQPDTPLAGLAPLAGVYAMSWGVAFSAGVLAWLALAWRRRAWLAALSLGLVWGAAAALRALDWTEPAGEPLRAALIQGNVPQELKWRPESRAPTLERYLALTERHWDADLVVWPETALPGLYHVFEGFLDALEREARRRGTDLLIGVPSRATDPLRYFNSVVSLGGARGLYHKRHLVPFGEYLPLAPVFEPMVATLGIRVSNFSRGAERQALLEAAGWPVGVSICYEATFGAEVIRALPEAALLVNVSNDAWFGASIGPHQHLQMTRLRALETGRFLLRATNTGLSAVIAPDGRIVTRSRQFETESIEAVATPRRGATPYVRAGDAPVLVLIALVLIVCVWRGRRRPPP